MVGAAAGVLAPLIADPICAKSVAAAAMISGVAKTSGMARLLGT
ncbi:hypothetical protein [Mycobacterium ulcerans]|nr:hypothetical protein [Mycobacterium ulcerans]